MSPTGLKPFGLNSNGVEIRSLIPRDVKMMAWTATATANKIAEHGKLLHCVPKFSEGKCGQALEEFLSVVVDVRRNRKSAEQIIFCRNFKDSAECFQYFKCQLNKWMYYPPSAPPISKFHLVDLFTRTTEEYVKDNIIKNSTSWLLLVEIGTIAFGMV